MHRWEKEARELIKKLQFKELSEQELQLWSHLRMALDELEQQRSEEEQRLIDANRDKMVNWDDIYGDGY